MAKGNMLQGQATGKVGDIVFMVRNGQQISRVYTASGGRSGDQASIAVRRQRVRFGAASNQYLLYRNIVRGMYRTGKQTRQSDYNFFVRENVDNLPYLTKEENAAGVKCVMPGTFSRGTLGSLSFYIRSYTEDDETYYYNVVMQSFIAPLTIKWNDTVGTLKTFLKTIFPNARKVTYSVSHILAQEIDVADSAQWTHTLERGDVVFDLYEADAEVPDTATISAYFSHYGPSVYQSGFWPSDTTPFIEDANIFTMESENNNVTTQYNYTCVMVFATNDQVGDCYTSQLGSVPQTGGDGDISLWHALRTENHKQVAEDSYGYATGVMRTNIQQA